MVASRAKAAFLAIVALLAGGLALLIAELPGTWQHTAILWVLIGCPVLFAVLRIYHGYTVMYTAWLAQTPRRPIEEPSRAGGGDRGHELQVIEITKSDGGRRLL